MLIRQPQKLSRVAPGLALLWCLTLMLTSFITPGGARAADSRYFPETQHTVSGKFLDYWNTHGGLPVFGYPITDPQNEVDPETGKTFLTQWFERNRFELHPENAGARYEVLLGLLGKDLRRDVLTTDPEFKPAQPLPGQTYYKETGHNLGGSFLAYWQQNGGLERFGFPVSEEHSEVDPETGKTFVSQWFERARFEHHPENQPPYDTLLGLLGKEIKLGKPVTGPVNVDWTLQGQAVAPFASLSSDPQGNLYLLNSEHSNRDYQIAHYTIKKYNQAGQLLLERDNNTELPYWAGVAADSQGNIYVTAKTAFLDPTAYIQKFDSQGKLLLSWKEAGGDRSFYGKTILAADSQANLYAVNEFVGDIEKYDSQGHLLFRIDKTTNPGLLQFIADLKVDSQDNLYVLDRDNANVRKFDSQGHLLQTIGSAGQGDGQFFLPEAMALDSQNNIYVAQLGSGPQAADRIFQKFNSAGQLLAKWGSNGGQIGDLYSMVVAGPNSLFVATTSPNLQKFDLDGQFQGRFAPAAKDQITCTTGFGLDPQGNAYVADAVNYANQPEQVQMFNSAGQFAGTVLSTASPNTLIEGFVFDKTGANFYTFQKGGSGYNKYDLTGKLAGTVVLKGGSPGVPQMLMVDQSGNLFMVRTTMSSKVVVVSSIDKYNPQGQLDTSWSNAPGTLNGIGRLAGIDTDSQGNVYIAGSNQVIKFSPTGQVLTQWGNSHSADGNFTGVQGLAVDSQGYVYLADADNNRILKFDGQGKVVAKWSGANGQFRQPDGLKLDKTGNIYITSGCSVQKLHPQSNPVN